MPTRARTSTRAGARLIARSRAMRSVIEQLARFAVTDATVLITGETGTGKNAIALELHARSPRARQPFVTVDCAALPATLIDSELFGHERGAFTDAIAPRAGRFELAGRGTVYLDAVNELTIEAQAKLLRIVEEKRVQRLGGRAPTAVHARVVASADASVEASVRDGTFRSDLYHRLRVLPIVVPPLRDRPEDILPLARHFASASAPGRTAPEISREAAAALRDYAWPGNVRQLAHAIRFAVAAARGRTIALGDLPADIVDAAIVSPDTLQRRPTLEEVERRYIVSTLRFTRGSQTDAARLLGISRKALWEKRRKFGLD